MKHLFGQRKFAPFFITQFWGAFNDNVFKNALIILITFNSVSDSTVLVNISAILFILPFFLFSSLAGQIGDKFEKSNSIRKIKLAEVVIMSLGAYFFVQENIYGLMTVLFLMGTQSALFGPIKYSILPQHLSENRLLEGNSLVEMGTFIAILVGTIYAGLTIEIEGIGREIIAVSIVVIALLGYLSSLFIPIAPANDPTITIQLNPFTQTKAIMQEAFKQPISVSRSILGISWFWFLGAVYLTQLPLYAKDFLQGDESLVTLLLATFSIGIGIGSVLCSKLSHEDIELGLVPIGAIGLTIFGVLLYFSTQTYLSGLSALPLPENGLHYLQFLNYDGAYSIIISMFLIGIFGGIYTVPLYTLIQIRSDKTKQSSVIAANNILNALFMVMAGIYSIVVLNVLDIPELLLSVVLLNILVSLYIFSIVPEFAMRFLTWCLLKFMYRIRAFNINVPKEGRVLLACNHVSFVDALILASVIRRPVRFIMYYKIYNLPIAHFIFKHSKAIPIAGQREDKAVFDAAFEEIQKALENDEAVFIFPEGKITTNGEMDVFQSGIDYIIKQTPTSVYPLALQGVWGSFFSKQKGRYPFKRIYSKVCVQGGELIEPENFTREYLFEQIAALKGDQK